MFSPDIGLHSAPIIANNVIVVGAAHKPGGVPKSRTNVKGYVRGFDAKTGQRLWTFHTIPKPSEFGIDTWEQDSWSYTGNTGSWGQASIDADLNMVYIGVEMPTGDYYGGHRPGNNLFSESIVALDLRTGQRKWHYQYIHHGIWDMDNPCPPILADITIGGRTVKAVAQPTKQAFMYVLDRQTGQPVWPIVERPVEKGTVPGEWYSPTQRSALQDRSDVHAPRGQQPSGSLGYAHAVDGGRRVELAGRVLRSGNAHRLCIGAIHRHGDRTSAADRRTIGYELYFWTNPIRVAARPRG